jgi:hypothetical protein
MSDSTVLTASGSGQTGASSGHDLVTQIARVTGGEGETAIRDQALDCLNRVRIELNQHDWRFMKTTDDPITLVSGTSTYSLDSTFRKPSHAILIDAAAIPQYDLRYEDDEFFSHAVPRQDLSGLPMYYLLRNDFSDGLVTVYPTPDNSTASTYRLVVEYYARIGAFADSTDTVDIPEEAINVLVIGGQAYLLRERQKGTPASAIAFQDYQRAKMLLLTDDRRMGDEKARFTLGTRRIYPFGTMFIKV